MTGEERLGEFRSWQERLSAYRLALSVMGVDANDRAPQEGAAYRGDRRAILTGEYRRLLQDDRMYEIVEALSEDDSLDGDTAREVSLVYEELKRGRSVPAELYAEQERALDASRRDWLRAKQENDYAGYAPYLQAVIDRTGEIYRLRAAGEREIYDLMLDDNQPGWDTQRYDRFFAGVKERVLPILREIGKREPADGSFRESIQESFQESIQESFKETFKESFLRGPYPVDGQRRVMAKIAAYLGVKPSWGKITESEHPLTTCICRGDIRLTTKYRVQNPALAILSTVHEAGHAWYGHNVDGKYDESAIARTISAGLHESQSRLCENHLGRSYAFWRANLPLLKEEFPQQLAGVSAEAFCRAVNAVKPTLIRTEADEVTYPLHILIRYELEKELFSGSLDAAGLEEAWNEKYRAYLGLTPQHAGEGVLQDMHWPYAYFGYFPTYALGSAIAAQIYAKLESELDVERLLLEGRFPEIMMWLGERVQRFGNRYPAEEIIRMACGEPFDSEYYFRWLENRYL